MEETKNEESGTATPYRAALAAVGLVPSGQENMAFGGFVPQTADELQATIESLRAQITRTAARSARRKAAIGQLNHGLACWKRLAESAQRLKGQYAEKHSEQADKIAALEEALADRAEVDRQIRETIWLGEPGSILDAVKALWANLTKAQDRVKDLDQKYMILQGSHDRLIAERNTALFRVAELERDTDPHVHVLNTLRAELEAEREKHSNALHDAQGYKDDYERTRNELEAAKAERDETERQLVEEKQSRFAAEDELAALHQPVDREVDAADPEWKKKVKAAHHMVSALCKPRGSQGSREWIMSIPANEAHDPDLVITDGLMAAERHIKYLEWQRSIASPDVLEQLAELMADEMGEPTITRTPHGMQRRMKAVAAILRAAEAYVDLPNDNIIVYRCGQTQIHGNEVAALNSRIRFRVALPETPNSQMQRCIDRKNRRIKALEACVKKWKAKAMDDPIAAFRRASSHNEWHESWVAANEPKVVAAKHNALLRDRFNEQTLAIQFVVEKLKDRCPACNTPKPMENVGIDWKPAAKDGAA